MLAPINDRHDARHVAKSPPGRKTRGRIIKQRDRSREASPLVRGRRLGTREETISREKYRDVLSNVRAKMKARCDISVKGIRPERNRRKKLGRDEQYNYGEYGGEGGGVRGTGG